MRKTTILSVCLAMGLTASVNAQSNEFDALLEDVTFGAAEQMVTTQAPEAADSVIPLPADPTPVPAAAPAPAAENIALPPTPQVTQPAPPLVDQAVPAPVAAPIEPVADHASAGACGTGCGSCQSCNSGHSCFQKNRIRDTPCVPYAMPRLPTSTFYQYWRTNACYTNVWDGYRNQCPRTLDLSIDKKHKSRSNCASGACMALPADWAAASASCDSCDSRR